jgi:hypothetical protein
MSSRLGAVQWQIGHAGILGHGPPQLGGEGAPWWRWLANP